MSSSSPVQLPTDSVPTSSIDIRSLVVRPVQFLGFWAGVLAPLAYLPLLLSGLDGQTVLLLAAVFFVNVLGLVFGRDYRADR